MITYTCIHSRELLENHKLYADSMQYSVWWVLMFENHFSISLISTAIKLLSFPCYFLFFRGNIFPAKLITIIFRI